MPRITNSPHLLAIGCAALASCAGDDARSHVHQSPPPVRATQSTAVAPPRPEPPLGTFPSASINSVRLAATGVVASLGDITDSIDVLTVVSRGMGSSSAGPARIELHLAGPTDTTLVESIGAPVPVVIAHDFRLAAGRGTDGLRDGLYRAQVRLVGPSGRVLSQSIPLVLTVRGAE